MEGPFGRDIYGIGKAHRRGGIGALVDGKVTPVAEVAERKWRVLSRGPVRAIGASSNTKDGRSAASTVDLTSRITQWAGEHGFEHRITITNGDGIDPRHRNSAQSRHGKLGRRHRAVGALATWGPPGGGLGGTKAQTVDLPDENLGVAVLRAAG